jgi:hypothetical protein
LCDDKCKFSLKIGVTKRNYDHVQNILDRINIPYDDNIVIDGNISKYDIVFMNCIYNHQNLIKEVSNMLDSYIKNGGVVYLTDLNYVFLSYEDSPFSKIFKFADRIPKGKYNVFIEDVGLKEALKKEKIDIDIDLSGDVANLEPDVKPRIYLKDEKSRPFSLSLEYGKGYVFFSTYHNAVQGTDQDIALKYFILQAISKTKASLTNSFYFSNGNYTKSTINSLVSKNNGTKIKATISDNDKNTDYIIVAPNDYFEKKQTFLLKATKNHNVIDYYNPSLKLGNHYCVKIGESSSACLSK